MKQINPIIYRITNLINGKMYVGKDLYNDPSYMGSGKLLKLAFNKYGKVNFKKEILETCTDEKHLNDREQFWISNLKAFPPNGYNINIGGKGGDTYRHRSEVDKISFRKAISKRNKGRKATLEVKLKMSQKRKGVPQKRRPDVECPHCHKIGDKINMSRWHFDFCKSNPNRILKDLKRITCPYCNRTLRANTAKQWHFEYCKNNPNRILKNIPPRIVTETEKDKRRETIRKNGGQHHTEEAKLKIGRYNKGKIISAETRKKMSESIKIAFSKRSTLYTCIHCNKSSRSVGNINRWHNDNCKFRKI